MASVESSLLFILERVLGIVLQVNLAPAALTLNYALTHGEPTMSLHLWAVSVTLSGEAGAGGLGEEVSARAATSRGIRGESGDPGLPSVTREAQFKCAQIEGLTCKDCDINNLWFVHTGLLTT